jgi:hypothetical protein
MIKKVSSKRPLYAFLVLFAVLNFSLVGSVFTFLVGLHQ